MSTLEQRRCFLPALVRADTDLSFLLSLSCFQFDALLSLVLPSFRPSVVVMCCGVDGLATDRMSPFNLTTRAYGQCVITLKKRLGHIQSPTKTAPPAAAAPVAASSDGDSIPMELSAPPDASSPPSSSSSPQPPAFPASPIPLLLLGGGGYHPIDSARAFTVMTASACGVHLPSAIPDVDQYYTSYMSTDFDLHSRPAPARVNGNSKAYLHGVLRHVKDKCHRWRKQTEEEEEA